MIRIQEFAENLKNLKVYLTGRYMTACIEHLIKLAIFDSSNNINHWRQEVYANFHNISKQKSNNKYPKAEFMLKTIWNYYGDDLEKYVKFVIEEEKDEKIKTDVTIKDVTDKIYEYILWLVVNLSLYGEVKSTDVYDKLKELGL